APFDRFVAGDEKAIDDSARRGWGLFNGKGRCNNCHAFSTVSPLFSDQKFHNIGIAAHKTDFIGLARKATAIVRGGDLKQIDELAIQTDLSELGRFLVTKSSNDIGAFKTPGLRNVAITSPYMHDGSFATLWDVMDHYNKGGVPNPNLDGGMQRLGLTEAEIDDMVSFMGSLTSAKFAAVGKHRAREGTRDAARLPARRDGRRGRAVHVRLHLRHASLPARPERPLRARDPEGGGRRQQPPAPARLRPHGRRPGPARPEGGARPRPADPEGRQGAGPHDGRGARLVP